MVAASGPTGILAGRPCASSQSAQQQPSRSVNNNNNHSNNNNNNNVRKSSNAEEEARQRHNSDLFVRTSWTDAAIALDQLNKVQIIIYLKIKKRTNSYVNKRDFRVSRCNCVCDWMNKKRTLSVYNTTTGFSLSQLCGKLSQTRVVHVNVYTIYLSSCSNTYRVSRITDSIVDNFG